jgi:hypothetical protein
MCRCLKRTGWAQLWCWGGCAGGRGDVCLYVAYAVSEPVALQTTFWLVVWTEAGMVAW